ncbi:Antizyme inhibitor 1 [Camelus dromedarius]|uniref:Antizyme inhibitor 1 n=1 Tax=Camelus dromedarius TaxID=9838 RepID=A0A5N4D8I6_CAMDR|nr:Antizyme inhibitor 1 [Camelus dromedarius]
MLCCVPGETGFTVNVSDVGGGSTGMEFRLEQVNHVTSPLLDTQDTGVTSDTMTENLPPTPLHQLSQQGSFSTKLGPALTLL